LSNKSRTVLFKMIQSIFPHHLILMNIRHTDIRFQNSDYSVKLDIFIPSLSLAFEYQSEYHYHYHFLCGLPKQHTQKEQEKTKLCYQFGVNLIKIPYWWDLKRDSLIATLFSVRPELVSLFKGNKIPNIPDKDQLNRHLLYSFNEALLIREFKP